MRLFFLLLLISPCVFAEPGEADETRGSTSAYYVQHQGDETSTEHDFIARTMPYLSIYDVEPPSDVCGAPKCWPTVHAFVMPAAFGGGQDIVVECTAFSGVSAPLATAADMLSLNQSEVGSVHMNFKDVDFAAIDHVICRIKQHRRSAT